MIIEDNKMFVEENIKTKVIKEYDIAVCGGGIAGISAALAAARQGKKVVLFEKQYILGGLGTAGLVTIYLPLCDGYGHQVSFGIAEELLHLSIAHGAEGKYPENWLTENGSRGEKDKRFKVQYNPQLFVSSSIWARTSDPLINSQVLCQLSYRGICLPSYSLCFFLLMYSHI